MLAIGDCLQNRYRVVRQLGHGGMGTVYEAHDERFENSVALKEVLIDLAKIADPVQQQMVARAFEREAKTLALLHHEAFPHVIDYFSERDHQYLIMELIRGEDLGEQLQARKKPFEFEDVLEWTKQLLDALDYLHTQEQPIIHRDLKPQNMKITARGKVKVLDFGIAKGADNKSSSTITNQTFVAATLNYSPIEQLLRVLDPTFREFISQRHKEKVEDILEHTADARSDLYSLGATLYQLLTATQPHDTLKRALDIWAGKPDPLPNPLELNPKIPPYFNSIMLKAMEIDRDSRFVSAAEMQQAIKQYMEGESRTESEFKQAAWIAEQQRLQSAPDIGQQTQLRIAEEEKFLAELDSPKGAKTEVLPSMGQQQQPTAQLPVQQFTAPVNQEEERRRIAEQQKFLAELDSPKNPEAGKEAPFQEAEMTNYGQVLAPSNEQADLTNYGQMQGGAASGVSSDQTQVSYLAGVLPAAQAKAADATVINPQVRPNTAQAAPVLQAEEPTTTNKLLWLIPVAGLGLLLVMSIAGFVVYKAFSNDGPKPSPTKTPYIASETPAPTPVQSQTEVPVVSEGNNSNEGVVTSTPTPIKTGQPKPTPEPRPVVVDNNPTPRPTRATTGVDNPTPRPTRAPPTPGPTKTNKRCTAEQRAMGECQ